MVGIAQLVRALDCGSRGRGFESHYLPKQKNLAHRQGFFVLLIIQSFPQKLIKRQHGLIAFYSVFKKTA